MTTTVLAPTRVATETTLLRLAAGVIALHVIDDSFLQPAPGTGPADHLVSGLVPLAVLALAAWAHPRLRGGRRGLLAVLIGVFGIGAGLEAVYYTRAVGPSGDDFTGLLCLPAGALAIGLGAVTVWRTRRRPSSLWRRALAGAGGLLAIGLVAIVGFGYVSTHTARAVVPPNALGVASEDVTFTTSDGLKLRGWYVPSRNGAAVIAFPGRKGPQAQARMLVRHGYGVLLFDRRGEGASEGTPHHYGWGGDRDVKAAISFLQRRPDVDPRRIGGIGLSVGGELMLETAADTPALAAVVSEGAGSRTFSEEIKKDATTVDRWVGAPAMALKTAALAIFSDQTPPTSLEDLVGRIAPRPVLLIAAPKSRNGEELNRLYHAAAHEPKALWEIPESRHIGGIAARPREYERRVVGFFDRALLAARA